MNRENKKTSLPCDPASTRRPLVSGPEGEKWATEGGGEVESQASSSADVTGPTTTKMETEAAVALRQSQPGPVLKLGEVRRQGRQGAKTEREAAERDAEGLGKGREFRKMNPAPSTYRGASRRAQVRQRRARDAEMMDTYHRLQRDGTLRLPGLEELAPPVVACMTRAVLQGATPSNATPTDRPGTIAKASTGRSGSEQQKKGLTPKPVPLDLTQALKTTPSHVTHSPVALDSDAAPRTGADSAPRPSKGKGKGKGKKGRKGNESEVTGTIVANTNTPHSGEGGEITRGAKRQRSSDQVSPTTAVVVDKKPCHREYPAAVTHLQKSDPRDTHKGDGETSYAEAAKAYHRVVVLDRRRVPMDELRAVHVRAVVERALYGVFMERRSRPTTRLPQFMTLPRSFRGGVRYTPRDDHALTWLTNVVERTPALWEGTGELTVVPESKVPRLHTAVIYIPDFGRGIGGLEANRLDTLVEFLAAMNPGAGVEGWRVFTHEVRHVGDACNHLLVVGIPLEDIERLRREDFRLHYACARVFVKVRGYNTAGKAVSGAATGAGGEGSTALSGETAPSVPEAEDHTVLAENLGWTREEEERLLGTDADEDGIDLRGLNIFSPASSMDMDRAEPSNANPDN